MSTLLQLGSHLTRMLHSHCKRANGCQLLLLILFVEDNAFPVTGLDCGGSDDPRMTGGSAAGVSPIAASQLCLI